MVQALHFLARRSHSNVRSLLLEYTKNQVASLCISSAKDSKEWSENTYMGHMIVKLKVMIKYGMICVVQLE